MMKTTLKLNEEMNEMKGIMLKQLGGEIITDLNPEQFAMFQKLFQIIDTFQELMVRQAELIEGIYKKLD